MSISDREQQKYNKKKEKGPGMNVGAERAGRESEGHFAKQAAQRAKDKNSRRMSGDETNGNNRKHSDHWNGNHKDPWEDNTRRGGIDPKAKKQYNFMYS